MKIIKISFKKLAIMLAAMLSFSSTQVQAVAVDAELSLVIDVSGSVSTSEYNLMMDGYANGFRDATIQNNILSTDGGDLGAIAVNVVFFSSNHFSTVLDAFTLLDSAAAISSFADTLDDFARPGSGGTAIYTGMNRSTDLFTANGFESTKLIMDVSGDGTSNTALDQAARDAAELDNITVNGISIGGTNIETYYNNNIKTSDGFVIHATDFATFETGIKDKLNVETGGNTVPEPATLALISLGLLGFSTRRQMK